MTTVLDQRRSVPSKHLAAPGPDDHTLLEILRSAVRVPDHGKLTPWRFLHIRGDARHRLGAVLAARTLAREPATAATAVEKERLRFSAAPNIIAVIGCIRDGDRIPVQEQLLSGGCVCFALLLAAQARGFGAQWLTSWAAYDREIAEHLGLAAHERVLGFIHIGTAQIEPPERERPDVRALLSEWTG